LPSGTPAPDVAELTRRGLALVRTRQLASIAEGVQVLRSAIALDPRAARAHALLAEALALGADGPSRTESLRLADTAVALEPGCADCLAARGFVRMIVEQRWADAGVDFHAALAIDPQATMAGFWLSNMLGWTGDFAAAGKALDRQERFEPQSARLEALRAGVRFYERAFDASIAASNRALSRDPLHRQSLGFKWMALVQTHRLEEAIEPLILDFLGRVPPAVAQGEVQWARQSFPDGGLTALVESLFKDRQAGSRRPYFRALLDVLRDRPDLVLAELEAALAEHDSGVLTIAVHPFFDGVRQHPRFVALVRRLHLEDVNAMTLRRSLGTGPGPRPAAANRSSAFY
jgi:hypothetical protein